VSRGNAGKRNQQTTLDRYRRRPQTPRHRRKGHIKWGEETTENAIRYRWGTGLNEGTAEEIKELADIKTFFETFRSLEGRGGQIGEDISSLEAPKRSRPLSGGEQGGKTTGILLTLNVKQLSS